MILIGISGKIGVGKTTVASILQRWGTAQSWRDFGDPIKEECAERFGFPLEWAYRADGKERLVVHPQLPSGVMHVRDVLQWWGTDVRRNQDPQYWIKKMNDWIRQNGPHSLVIADIRFMEEAEFILHLGGWLFRIEPYPGYAENGNDTHRSEVDLDHFSGWHSRLRPEYGYKSLHAVAREIASIVP